MILRHKTMLKRIFFVIIFVVIFELFFDIVDDIDENRTNLEEGLHELAIKNSIELINPFMLYIDSDWKATTMQDNIINNIWEIVPMEKYLRENCQNQLHVNEYLQNATVTMAVDSQIKDTLDDTKHTEKLQKAVIAENRNKNSKFIPVDTAVAEYLESQLRQEGFIKESFYTEDPTTQLKDEQIQFDKLMSYDATIKQDSSKPQILVYHTHSQETYADSDISDKTTTIVGVGEYLCEILRKQYGFNVIHHTGEYDIESRDFAYSNAMVGLEKVLQENPTIEVMIDLHRDEVNPDTKLVTTIQNIPMAKFMFFNGLCYTNELGALTSLPNQYIQENLSFAFQMQLFTEEYYPGLTRKIYLKGYRYNLHYRPKSLLVELGAQTNTLQEAKNSCEPLAHVIAMVLKGNNKK